MTTAGERRALQVVVALLCVVPLSASTAGIVGGAAWLAHGAPVTPDLDSHFRYLSGVFLGMGLGFAACIPGIERNGARMRWFGLMVVLGGAARALSLAQFGAPSIGHLVGLGIELVAVPLVLAWQARVARRCAPAPTG